MMRAPRRSARPILRRYRQSVAIVFRLEGTLAGNADIGGLLLGELGELGAELGEMQASDLLVELLRQHIDLVVVVLALGEELAAVVHEAELCVELDIFVGDAAEQTEGEFFAVVFGLEQLPIDEDLKVRELVVGAELAAVLGASLAGIARNTAFGVGVTLGHVAVVEPIVRVLKPSWDSWFLAENIARFVTARPMTTAEFEGSTEGALLRLTIYVAIAAAFGTWLFQRRDLAGT